jgi:hypothetical protein
MESITRGYQSAREKGCFHWTLVPKDGLKLELGKLSK